MSTSTKITLPYYIRNQHILFVVAKILGTPFEKDVYPDYTAGKNHMKKSIFYPDLPASESNDWHFEFHKDNASMSANSDATTMSFILKDLNENRHNLFCMLEDADDEQGKKLNIDSSVLNVIIAKRLVDFFGGHAIFNENGEDDVTAYVAGKSGVTIKFPKKNQKQTSNDRFFQFVNLLDKEPLITIAEMDWAASISSYNTNNDQNFYKRLQEIEVEKFYDNLNEKTPQKIESKSKKKI